MKGDSPCNDQQKNSPEEGRDDEQSRVPDNEPQKTDGEDFYSQGDSLFFLIIPYVTTKPSVPEQPVIELF